MSKSTDTMSGIIPRGDYMTKYEQLMAKHDDLYIEERPMKNDGLYADGCVWINSNMPESRKYCTLAEEIGHYETSVGDILDLADTNNRRQENIARKWAYEEILPRENILFALQDGHTEIWDMAEYLDVDEEFLKGALKHYGLLDIYV